MRQIPYVFAALWLMAAAADASNQSPPKTPPAPLVGTWRAVPEELPLATEFDESVWGKNAKSVRTVDLAVRAGGDATLTVTRKVVDAKGHTVKGSTSVEEATIRIDTTTPAAPRPDTGRTELPVTVTSAERRYPDDPGAKWPIEGLKVMVVRLAEPPGAIEIRFDTPEGKGSFWETLRKSR
jgi:hypothetical protein